MDAYVLVRQQRGQWRVRAAQLAERLALRVPLDVTGGEFGVLAVRRVVLNCVRFGHRSDGTRYDGGTDPFACLAGKDRVAAFKLNRLNGCRHFDCLRR